MTHVERKREDARRLAHQAGARVYPFGVAWRVVGPTVDMLLSDLALLTPADFVRMSGAPHRVGQRAESSRRP